MKSGISRGLRHCAVAAVVQAANGQRVEPRRHEIAAVVGQGVRHWRAPKVGETSNRERAPATGLVAPNSELSVTNAVVTT